MANLIPQAPRRRILRLPALLDMVGMRRSWLYRELAEGRFPAPVKLGRASGRDVDAVDCRIAGRLGRAQAEG